MIGDEPLCGVHCHWRLFVDEPRDIEKTLMVGSEGLHILFVLEKTIAFLLELLGLLYFLLNALGFVHDDILLWVETVGKISFAVGL